jgi:hypothetical protein
MRISPCALERHPLGSQAFISLSGNPYAVVVAPPGELDESRIRGFLAQPSQGVNYHMGTWHHYLLALEAASDFVVSTVSGPATTATSRPWRHRSGWTGIMSLCAHRGSLLHFLEDPATAGDEAWEYHEDGALLVEDGLVVACGPATSVLDAAPQDTLLVEHPNALLCPGFIDAHVHYPQLDIVGAHGEQLLELARNATCSRRKPASRTGPMHAVSPGVSCASSCATAPPPHWCSAPCIPSPSTPSSRRRSPEPAHDCRQGADGPQRAGVPARHVRSPPTPTASAPDPATGTAAAAALRGHPAFRAHLVAAAARRPGACCASTRGLPAHPHVRERQRNRLGGGAVPAPRPLPAQLRRRGPAGPAQRFRALHPPVRRGVAAHGRHALQRRLLPHLQPVPGLRPVSAAARRARGSRWAWARISAPAPASRCWPP